MDVVGLVGGVVGSERGYRHRVKRSQRLHPVARRHSVEQHDGERAYRHRVERRQLLALVARRWMPTEISLTVDLTRSRRSSLWVAK
jgi:hypothetical protein